MKKFFLLGLFVIFESIFGAANKVAKVIVLKGEVQEMSSGKNRTLKKGDWVIEGSTLHSSARSFVKLLFIDKSQMNLGANSEMVIKEFPKNKAGIINLIRGKVRAKVTKDYMQIDKSNSKLFIKTKTAAMGVRGTDFQVFYNPSNKVTSLLTFEGAVAMTKISEQFSGRKVNQQSLERQLNAPKAVMVRQGQYSGSTPGKSRVSEPVKISPTQLESLRGSNENSAGGSEEKSSTKNTKKGRSMVPPGIDPKKLSQVSNSSVDAALGSTVGKESFKKVKMKTQDYIAKARQDGPPPEGFEDKRTGAHAPTSGGFIDSRTGLYIPPPEGSSFDANNGVYIPSPEVGSLDSETGAYIAPEGLAPSVKEGKLVFVSKRSTGRGPASVGSEATFTPKSLSQDTSSKSKGVDRVDHREIFRERRHEIEGNNKDRNAILQTGRARVKFRISR